MPMKRQQKLLAILTGPQPKYGCCFTVQPRRMDFGRGSVRPQISSDAFSYAFPIYFLLQNTYLLIWIRSQSPICEVEQWNNNWTLAVGPVAPYPKSNFAREYDTIHIILFYIDLRVHLSMKDI
ncbi:hypothetical protein TGAM01_v205361 [Trichoderma gamsii]|uniref:Uncharacterized protein n=1 Tax=Trichoderma gamsii TaxID=398673 RepID=A0A2P4ZNT6_9HYPO|nr:hypothetical protein TGAM01_v205361 [Trichoderma gamsii]PON25924.1 hypothetical protein TGAM01_v205361 [Trichoderma gamsii]